MTIFSAVIAVRSSYCNSISLWCQEMFRECSDHDGWITMPKNGLLMLRKIVTLGWLTTFGWWFNLAEYLMNCAYIDSSFPKWRNKTFVMARSLQSQPRQVRISVARRISMVLLWPELSIRPTHLILILHSPTRGLKCYDLGPILCKTNGLIGK